MNKLISLSLIVALPMVVVAKKPKVYKNASMECPAYNDMKHKNNSNRVQLKVGKSYRILQKNKGQILTLIEGERVAQRWVDEACFGVEKKEAVVEEAKKDLTKKDSSKSDSSKKASSFADRLSQNNKAPIVKTSKQNLLALSWQNAFCQTHQYKKECKHMNANSFGAFEFVLHGLWPQPRNNQYCKVDKKQIGMDKNKQWNRLNKLELDSSTRKELSKYMPGYGSNLHKHEWIKHGTCYGTSANDYYAAAISLLKQVNESKVQQYFKQNVGKIVSLKEVRKLFDKEFGSGAGKHVTMNCKGGLVTELWLHTGNGSNDLKELFKSGEKPRSRCQKGRVDAVGF
jgi:ribonuclease T2